MADKTIQNSTWGGPIKLVDLGDETYGVAVDVRNADEIGGGSASAETVSDGSPIAVTNAAGGVSVAAANEDRLSIAIQNVGTKAVLLRLGGDPSTSNYNFVLAGDTALRAGNGGSVVITEWKGAIKAICEDVAGSALAVTEYTV